MPDTATPELVQLARDAAAWFETAKRPNGDEFDKLRDGAPKWLKDAIYAAHDDGAILPDDHRYRFAREAFTTLADSEEGADLDDIRSEFADDVDVYTSGLTAWLGSHSSRQGYADEALEDYGAKTMSDAMQAGQAIERGEVFDAIRAALTGQLASTPD